MDPPNTKQICREKAMLLAGRVAGIEMYGHARHIHAISTFNTYKSHLFRALCSHARVYEKFQVFNLSVRRSSTGRPAADWSHRAAAGGSSCPAGKAYIAQEKLDQGVPSALLSFFIQMFHSFIKPLFKRSHRRGGRERGRERERERGKEDMSSPVPLAS